MEDTPVSNNSPSFLRARTIGFSITSLLAFVWAVLLCVDLFILWTVMDTRQRSLVIVMLSIQVLTVFTLLILLVIAFKPWLDAARIALLLVLHVGIASAFTVFYHTFHCYSDGNTKDSDDQGVCQMTGILIIIGSWIVPVLLLTYAFGLAFMVHRKRTAKISNPTWDLEKAKRSRTSLPIMDPSEEYAYEPKQDPSTPRDLMHSRRDTWIPPTPIASRMSSSGHSRSKSKSRSSKKVSIDYTYGAQISPDPFRASTTPSQYHANNIYRAPSSNVGNARRDTWIPPDPYRSSTTPSQFHTNAGARLSKPLPIATVW